MKIKITAIVAVLLFITCSKENLNNRIASASKANTMIKNDTIAIPLNDLGSGRYRDSVGGLYPGGANKPSGDYANDLNRVSKLIVPLDTFGNSSVHGKTVFISLGASTGGHNMKQLKAQTQGNPKTNPNLLLLNCNDGKRTASLISQMYPNDPYWDHVTQIIHGAGSSYRQVQIIYLEADDSSQNIIWPAKPLVVKTDLETCLRVYKQKFPNIKVVYVLGRTKTFGKQIAYNTEPAPYYFGWGCKWTIEDQINGVAGTAYKGKNAVAPMITWGFYQWADSLPRITDGFYWRSAETSDGLHATPQAQDTLATRFQNFLLTDRYARIWYAAH